MKQRIVLTALSVLMASAVLGQTKTPNIDQLKRELKQKHIELDETDADDPGIQEVIDASWDVQPTNSSLVYMGSDGRLEYKPYTKQGDKIIDYSYCGYKKSEEPIPDVPVVETLSPLPGEAKPEKNMAYPEGPDSRGQIQEALDKVAAMQADTNSGFRGAVLLKKGTYYVNGELILDSGVVLRGEGDDEDGTVLIFRNPKGTGISAGRGVTTTRLDAESEIRDRYVPAGSRSITLRKADDFKAGDMVLITKVTNDDWIETLGMDRISGEGNRPWKADGYQLKHVRMITQVTNNTLTLDVPLPQSFDRNHCKGTVQAVDLSGSSRLCGVEGLRIISNYDTSVKSDVRAYDGPYFADEEENLACGVKLKCINGWVRNCTVMHTRAQSVQMNGSRYTTVRDCRSLQPVSVIRGARRYSFSNGGGTLGLVYQCFAEFGRHDYVTGSRETGPIAFVKCRSQNARAPSEPHHRWTTGVLYDNIVMKDGGFLQAVNRGASGSGHGWAGANVVFWNCAADVVLVSDPPTSEQNFAIGYTGEKKDSYPTNYLGYANNNVDRYEGKRGKKAEYKGFALMGNGFIEAPDRPVNPKSLFTQQLIDRIGEDQAMKVLKK